MSDTKRVDYLQVADATAGAWRSPVFRDARLTLQLFDEIEAKADLRSAKNIPSDKFHTLSVRFKQ